MEREIPKLSGGAIDEDNIKTTYYILDAQGNTMAKYVLKEENYLGNPEKKLELSSRNLYGSSMLGQEEIHEIIASTEASLVDINTATQLVIGDKRMLLQNHLGNLHDTWVLTNKTLSGINRDRSLSESSRVHQVVTDRKLPEEDNGAVAYFYPDVVSHSDFMPFGMEIESRSSSVSETDYGFNGMYADDEMKGKRNSYDFGARMYDPRVGRWLSRDPLEGSYPMASPYIFANNSPLVYNDPDGKSGELTIVKDANGKPTKYVIKADLHFYTGDESLSNFDHKRVAKEMMKQFNDQNMELSYDGQTLPVELDLTSDLTYSNEFNNIRFEDGNFNNSAHTDALKEMPGNNTDYHDLRNNYIRIEDLNRASYNIIGGQTGLWNVNELGEESTTGLHEFLHGLGMIHPREDLNDGSGGYREVSEVDVTPGDPIPISYPKTAKYKSTGDRINANDRETTQSEVDQFILNVQEITGNTYIGVGHKSQGRILTDKSGNTEDFTYEE